MPFPGPTTFPSSLTFPGLAQHPAPVQGTTGQREVQTPHFSLPFRFGGLNGSAFVTEQDSDADVVDCIKVILAYPIGSREDLPPFGRPDILFTNKSEALTHALQAAIARWEPRASVGSREVSDLIDQFNRTVVIAGKGREHG